MIETRNATGKADRPKGGVKFWQKQHSFDGIIGKKQHFGATDDIILGKFTHFAKDLQFFEKNDDFEA